jgi:hypothetical protein
MATLLQQEFWRESWYPMMATMLNDISLTSELSDSCLCPGMKSDPVADRSGGPIQTRVHLKQQPGSVHGRYHSLPEFAHGSLPTGERKNFSNRKKFIQMKSDPLYSRG